MANSAGHCSHRCRQNPFLSARKMHLANDESGRAEQSQEKQGRGSERPASLLSSPKWNERVGRSISELLARTGSLILLWAQEWWVDILILNKLIIQEILRFGNIRKAATPCRSMCPNGNVAKCSGNLETKGRSIKATAMNKSLGLRIRGLLVDMFMVS